MTDQPRTQHTAREADNDKPKRTPRREPRKDAKTPTRAGVIPNAAQIDVRRRQTHDMVIAGLPHQVIAEQLGVAVSTVSVDYRRALAEIYEPSQSAAEAMRGEITARTRSIIAGNIEAARQGDVKAAAVIVRGDALLADIWSLRSMTVSTRVVTPADLEAKLTAYLQGVRDSR